MFYCDPCAEAKRWPKSVALSFGTCESCGQTAACNDVPGHIREEQP